jgi:hypothetical protein
MGGAMLRDFAIVATAFEVQVREARKAGMVGAVSLLLGTVVPFIVGAWWRAFGYNDAVSMTTIGAGAVTYIVGPVTGAALGASSDVIALSIATGLIKAIIVMVGTPFAAGFLGLNNPRAAWCSAAWPARSAGYRPGWPPRTAAWCPTARWWPRSTRAGLPAGAVGAVPGDQGVVGADRRGGAGRAVLRQHAADGGQRQQVGIALAAAQEAQADGLLHAVVGRQRHKATLRAETSRTRPGSSE